jgi:transposase
MTRGDRRRNARRDRLRGLLPRDGVVVGIDLAEDKQALAVIDHDVRVLARKTVKVKAFRLGEALDWAVAQARAKGFTSVTVACEPTGPRWMQVQRLCAERGLPLVCIQPLMSHIAREQQDYTTHKTDEADCVMIARLAIELHCYIPEELDETWAHLRHLGRRRAQLITAETASMQRIREFLSVAWPTVTETCAQPLKSVTWLTALQVVTSRCGGEPGGLAAMGEEAFTALVRGAVAGWGGKKAWGTICRRIFAALGDTEGVVAWSRRGLLRRVADELGDLQRTRAQRHAVEADMVAVLDELGLSRLADIPALTAVGAAAILAETGDPRRYDGSSSLDGHAGMSPSDNASGAFAGQAHISRRGRPGPAAGRLARGGADAPVQPGDDGQVPGDDPRRRRRGSGRRTADRHGGAGRSPRPARQGPRRVRRLPAALDLLHGRPRDQLGSRRRRRRRQLPRHPAEPGGGSLTSASTSPAPAAGARDLPPR